MSSLMTDYANIFLDQLRSLEKLLEEQQRLRQRLEKHQHMIAATFDLMDEKEKSIFSEAFVKVQRSEQSLTEDIRFLLTKAERDYLTAGQLREQLVDCGYDFTRYRSNPLTSIYSTLHRMRAELEVVTLQDGSKAYRLRPAPARNRPGR
jgi:hypothetical protein